MWCRIHGIIFFYGLKLWNVAVELSTVFDNGTRSVAVMCFSELQVSTSYILSNSWNADILCINIGFVATKLNGEFPEQLTSSRYLLNAGRTFFLVTTNFRHCWRDLTSERLRRDGSLTACYECIDISQDRSASIIRNIYVFILIRCHFLLLHRACCYNYCFYSNPCTYIHFKTLIYVNI
jgi:hypothetical protein